MYELILYERRNDHEELIQTYKTGVEDFTGIMLQQAINHAMQMPDPAICYIIDHEGKRIHIPQPANRL